MFNVYSNLLDLEERTCLHLTLYIYNIYYKPVNIIKTLNILKFLS